MPLRRIEDTLQRLRSEYQGMPRLSLTSGDVAQILNLIPTSPVSREGGAMRTVFLVVTLILTLGLGFASAQSADEAALNTRVEGHFAATAKGDATADAACYTENAVRALGTNVVAGRANIEKAVRVQAPEAKHHRVLADYDAYGSVSPDGRFVSRLDWTDGANIVVRDLRTGERRQLTDSGRNSEGRAWLSAISPDAKQVAYGWTSWQEDWAELRVVGLDGSPPRVLYRDETIRWVNAHGWSPDGSQILTMLSTGGTRQIALVSVIDGSVRVLKSVDHRLGRTMSFSPDGQYIAYDHPVQGALMWSSQHLNRYVVRKQWRCWDGRNAYSRCAADARRTTDCTSAHQ